MYPSKKKTNLRDWFAYFDFNLSVSFFRRKKTLI